MISETKTTSATKIWLRFWKRIGSRRRSTTSCSREKRWFDSWRSRGRTKTSWKRLVSNDKTIFFVFFFIFSWISHTHAVWCKDVSGASHMQTVQPIQPIHISHSCWFICAILSIDTKHHKFRENLIQYNKNHWCSTDIKWNLIHENVFDVN